MIMAVDTHDRLRAWQHHASRLPNVDRTRKVVVNGRVIALALGSLQTIMG
jgi:hypothetical protein